MFQSIKQQVLDLIRDKPRHYTGILRAEYPDLMRYLKDNYPPKSEGLYCWLHDISAPVGCKQCGVACKFNSICGGGYREFCSASCRAKHFKSYTNAHNPDGTLKASVRAKNSAKAGESLTKRLNTFNKTNAVDMYEHIGKKRAASYIESVPDELKDRDACALVEIPLDEYATKLGVTYGMVLKWFRKHGLTAERASKQYSGSEWHVGELLTELGVEYVRNDRTILTKRRELDIYVPSLNLAIEYCGLFWHSDRNNYSPTKHQEKFLECQRLGIKLITIFEDEWIFNRAVVESRITSLVGKNTRIFARKCTIGTVAASVSSELLTKWHIQGPRGSKSNISLSYGGEVVAVCTYGKPRYGKEDIEILRFATKPGTTVVGGFSKLLKAVQKQTGATTIVSFSDNRWGDGRVYARAGMVRIGVTQPSYWYFLPAERKRYHRSTFMKHKIVEDMGGNPELTEVENMREFGYTRIFDCGTTKWVLEQPT